MYWLHRALWCNQILEIIIYYVELNPERGSRTKSLFRIIIINVLYYVLTRHCVLDRVALHHTLYKRVGY